MANASPIRIDEVVADRATLNEIANVSGISTRTLYRLKSGACPSPIVKSRLIEVLGPTMIFATESR